MLEVEALQLREAGECVGELAEDVVVALDHRERRAAAEGVGERRQRVPVHPQLAQLRIGEARGESPVLALLPGQRPTRTSW